MSDKRIEVDIAAAIALLQESPELCEVMNKLVGVPALDAALAEIELLRAERDAMREAGAAALKDLEYFSRREGPGGDASRFASIYKLRAALAPSPAGDKT